LQVPVDVGMAPTEYVRRFEEVEWPVFDVCPICGAHARLQGHGSYSRNSLPDRETELVTPIHRLRCPVCHRTVSLLPSFLLPFFQHTARFVVKSLLGKVKSYRELLRFHWRRFLANANRVLAFLRDLDMRERLPEDGKERAMKLLGSIETSGLEMFSMLFQKHYHRGFMADSSYLPQKPE
jgi:phytoene dehydrogenase-like protein